MCHAPEDLDYANREVVLSAAKQDGYILACVPRDGFDGGTEIEHRFIVDGGRDLQLGARRGGFLERCRIAAG